MDDAELIGYIFDALEPAEQEAIEERMARDPELAARVEALRKFARPLADDDVIEPPEGLAGRTFEFSRRVPLRSPPSDWLPAPNRARPLDIAVAVCLMIAAATLVFPAVLMLRGDQSRVLCANQLRGLGVTLAQYSNFENGQLPFVADHGPMNNAGIFSVCLKSRDLLTDSRSLICPSADSAMVMVPEVDKYLQTLDNPVQVAKMRQFMGGSYGYVLGYQQDGRHGGFGIIGQLRPIASDRPPRAGETEMGNSPNHQDRGQNVLYGDGSVRWLTSHRSGLDDIFRNAHCEVAAGIGPDDTVIGVSESVPYPEQGL